MTTGFDDATRSALEAEVSRYGLSAQTPGWKVPEESAETHAAHRLAALLQRTLEVPRGGYKTTLRERPSGRSVDAAGTVAAAARADDRIAEREREELDDASRRRLRTFVEHGKSLLDAAERRGESGTEAIAADLDRLARELRLPEDGERDAPRRIASRWAGLFRELEAWHGDPLKGSVPWKANDLWLLRSWVGIRLIAAVSGRVEERAVGRLLRGEEASLLPEVAADAGRGGDSELGARLKLGSGSRLWWTGADAVVGRLESGEDTHGLELKLLNGARALLWVVWEPSVEGLDGLIATCREREGSAAKTPVIVSFGRNASYRGWSDEAPATNDATPSELPKVHEAVMADIRDGPAASEAVLRELWARLHGDVRPVELVADAPASAERLIPDEDEWRVEAGAVNTQELLVRQSIGASRAETALDDVRYRDLATLRVGDELFRDLERVTEAAREQLTTISGVSLPLAAAPLLTSAEWALVRGDAQRFMIAGFHLTLLLESIFSLAAGVHFRVQKKTPKAKELQRKMTMTTLGGVVHLAKGVHEGETIEGERRFFAVALSLLDDDGEAAREEGPISPQLRATLAKVTAIRNRPAHGRGLTRRDVADLLDHLVGGGPHRPLLAVGVEVLDLALRRLSQAGSG